MPITIKTANMKYKNSEGEYVGVNAISDNTTAEQLARIEDKGDEVIASIPSDYTALETQVNNIEGMIASEFSTSTAYAIGDLVIYNDNYYRFKTAHPAGAWNASHVDQTTVSGEIISNVTDLKNSYFTFRTYAELTDLNNATEMGNYQLSYSYDYDNLPAELRPHTNEPLFLKVYPASGQSNPVISQELTVLSGTHSGDVYVRYRTGGGTPTWQSWKKVLSTEIDNIKTTLSEKSINLLPVLDWELQKPDSSASFTVTNLHNGQYKLSGIVGTNRVILLYTLVLSAGTYRVGYANNTGIINIQVRDYTGGSDQGGLAQTAKYTTFTLDSEKQVGIRLIGTTGRSFNGEIIDPMLCLSDKWYQSYKIPFIQPQYTAYDSVARNESYLSFKFFPELEENDDLNNIDKNGWTGIPSSANILNAPNSDTGQRIVFSYLSDGYYMMSSSSFRHQAFINYTTGLFAWRIRGGGPNGQWSAWKILNSPEISKSNNISQTFQPISINSQGANTGTKLRIMSYNICCYTNDTHVSGNPVYISDEKLFNLKNMFMNANADILGIQEDKEYIDAYEGTGTKLSDNYVFFPIYPYRYGVGGNTIHSKVQPSNTGNVLVYSNGRGLRYAVFSIDEKNILFISTHPGLTVEERSVQYEELFDWVEGRITLRNYADTADVSVPTHTHCIICGDMNSETDEDKTKLVSEATSDNFILGNGGYLGWVTTLMRGTYMSIDNIIVSNNIIINKFEAYNSWYDKLYSDHVPLVADLTLL